MRKILITGAAGFIGSNLLDYFATKYPHYTIFALDSLRGSQTSLGNFKNINLHPNVRILSIDITDSKSLMELGNFDIIFHQAALTDTTYFDSGKIMEINFNSFKNLIHLSDKIVYASSTAVYGNTPPPFIVGINEKPESIYGFSKLCMDHFSRYYSHEKKIIIGLRYSNVYGHNEFYKGKTASMILQLGLQALLKGEVNLFEYGEQKRDFVYIKDIVQANDILLQSLIDMNFDSFNFFAPVGGPYSPPTRSRGGVTMWEFIGAMNDFFKDTTQTTNIYNVGSGISYSFNELVEILKCELNLDFKVNYIKNPYTFFQNHIQLNNECFIKNYVPKYTLQNGIKDYIEEIKMYATKINNNEIHSLFT